MGWVDLDLNLPPPPPDPDGFSPLPSPTPLREQDRGEGFVGAGGEERGREERIEKERDGDVADVPVIERAGDDVAVAVAAAVSGGESALRVFDGVAEEGKREEEAVERGGLEAVNVEAENLVLLREQDAKDEKVERKVESEDEEDDVVSRARGRIEVDAGAGGGGEGEGGGSRGRGGRD
jgi:hypothetical protein